MGRFQGRTVKVIVRVWVIAVIALGAGVLAAIGAAQAPAAGPPPPPVGGGSGCNSDSTGSCNNTPTPPPATTGTPGSGPVSGPTSTPTSTPRGTSTTTGTSTSSTPPPVTVGGGSTKTGGTLRTPRTPVNVINPSTPTAGSTPPTPTPVIVPVATVPAATPTPTVAVSTPQPPPPRPVHHHAVAHKPPPKPPAKPKPAKPKPAPPKPPAHHKSLPHSVKVTSSVVTPQHIKFKAGKVALAVALGALLVLLLAFPAELFNKTYDENEEEIHHVLSRVGLRRHHLSPVWGLLAFTVVGAGMTIWLALAEGGDGNPVAVAVGLLIALPVVTFAFEVPAEFYLRTRSKVPGKLHVLPTALAVAVVCALVTRLIKLQPAYLYGIFASFTAVRAGSIAEEEEGKSVLVGAAATMGVGALAWFGWGALDSQAHGPERDWLVILASTAMFWIFVLAAEGLVFGLMPLKYLDGALLKAWRSSVWLIAQVAAAAFFVYVQMLHGSTKEIQTFSDLVKPYLLFVGFGLFSLAFWRYFQWKGRPSALKEEGAREPRQPIPVVAAAIAASQGNGATAASAAPGNGAAAAPAPVPDEPESA